MSYIKESILQDGRVRRQPKHQAERFTEKHVEKNKKMSMLVAQGPG
jgi:hypothetical protein